MPKLLSSPECSPVDLSRYLAIEISHKRNTVLPHAPYLATDQGKEVLDKSEIISDQIVGGLVAQLMKERFEATTNEWVDGFFIALEVVLGSASEEGRADALNRMKQLTTGEIVLS